MAGSIILKEGKFILKGKPFLLYSGEIHYFRTPRKNWKSYVLKAKSAGLNTVSTYIPWSWHESKEGRFDITGKTARERNLLGFMDICSGEGLYMLLRPGPICHGEMINDGLPSWLVSGERDIFMKRKDGSVIGSNFVSFSSSLYREFVSRWYENIIPHISERQITEGGNVILLQLDNEISMINWCSGQPDFSDSSEAFYRNFLKAKYGSISSLNGVYGSRYEKFSDLKMQIPEFDADPDARYWDWADFWREYYSDYYLFLAQKARSLGIKVPLSANIAHFLDFDVYGRGLYSPMTTSMFRSFPAKVDKLVMGGAYQMRRLDYENFHDIAVTTETVKAISSKDSPVICAELQTGIMFDKPVIYPSDVDLNILNSCAHGLNGLNCYMFGSGKNPPEIGAMGTYHKWQAPVNIDCGTEPHYEPIGKWGRFFGVFGAGIAETEKNCDAVVGMYFPYYMTEYLKGNFAAGIVARRNRLFYDGVCRLLELSGCNFRIADVQKEMPDKDKVLIMTCFGFMEKGVQEKLADFVLSGGSLILGPELPDRDLGGGSCEVIKNMLGVKSGISDDVFIKDKKYGLMSVERPVRFLESDKAEGLYFSSGGQPVAVSKRCGEGSLIAYGFGLSHVFDYHIDIMSGFLRRAGVRPRVEKSNRRIQTVLRAGKKASFLFVSNFHQLEETSGFTIRMPGGKKVSLPSKGELRLEKRSCRIIPLDFPVTEDIAIAYCTAHVLGFSVLKKSICIVLRADGPDYEEIAFNCRKPISAKISGKKLSGMKKGGIVIYRIKGPSEKAKIEIDLL
ncbi:MAG: beta-galactosidase [Candidatus Aureabacteria bacterium]|nr:beta-galactosidase [Candidatus Auribacterota bacterium]